MFTEPKNGWVEIDENDNPVLMIEGFDKPVLGLPKDYKQIEGVVFRVKIGKKPD